MTDTKKAKRRVINVTYKPSGTTARASSPAPSTSQEVPLLVKMLRELGYALPGYPPTPTQAPAPDAPKPFESSQTRAYRAKNGKAAWEISQETTAKLKKA